MQANDVRIRQSDSLNLPRRDHQFQFHFAESIDRTNERTNNIYIYLPNSHSQSRQHFYHHFERFLERTFLFCFFLSHFLCKVKVAVEDRLEITGRQFLFITSDSPAGFEVHPVHGWWCKRVGRRSEGAVGGREYLVQQGK